MTLEEIRASGLLELYVMGQLSAREHEIVERALRDFPELKKDLREIEVSLEHYARSASIKAPSGVKEKIMREVSTSGEISKTTSSAGTGWRVAALIGGLAIIGLLYLLMQRNRELRIAEERYVLILDSCRQENQMLSAQIEMLRQITLQDNQILHMAGTQKYPQTDLYFHHNPVTKRNFIQVRNLPPLASDQSFQLWSIKSGEDPVPLDVFQTPTDRIIEVRHIDASQAYAITIEPLGGRPTPSLADLIGIVQI